MLPTDADSVDVRDTSEHGWRQRTSQEIALRAAEFALVRERNEQTRIQHVFASQRTARLGGAAALGGLAILMTHGEPAQALWVVAAVVVYARLVWLMGRVIRGEQSPVSTRRTAARALLIGDGLAVATLSFLAGPDALALIPVIGVLLVSVAAFSFGPRDGVMTAGAVLVGYAGTLLLTRLTVDVLRPTATMSVVNVVVFCLVSGAAIELFGRFRQRIDALRVYCKLGELGESFATIPVEARRAPDDLTALAGSFDAMRTRLAEQIGSDPLTGCANRLTLEKRLLADWRLARRQNTAVAVAAIDIDHFKVINDTRGHPVGDLVLQQVASIMLSAARDTDTVARLGGDEFVILLPDSDAEGAVSFAERLREIVMEFPFGSPGAPLALTISVGVAITAGVAPMEPEQLMADADRLLYRAKQDGRNRVCAS